MSTRASIIIKDDATTLYLYRHSDGYPNGCGVDLKEFVEGYANGSMRNNAPQSAGWLILRGHWEYRDYKAPTQYTPDTSDRFSGWKVGAYEPTDGLAGDAEYIYIIDLEKMTLSCRQPGAGYWDAPNLKNTRACSEFKMVRFGMKVVA